MSTAGNRLDQIADELKEDKTPLKESARTIVGWFGAQRRGFYIVREVRDALDHAGLITDPDFNDAYIDTPISFRLKPPAAHAPQLSTQSSPALLVERAAGVDPDPTYRIAKLKSANVPPVSVTPNTRVDEIITTMLTRGFSQLPVMEGERNVRGVVSWESIGARLALGKQCATAQDCMDSAHILPADKSLFETIDEIVTNQYVLIRGTDQRITGIVTTSDLSLQFRQLGEPFLLIGEIENYVRKMVASRFTLDALDAAKDTSDRNRVIHSVSDLTFGELTRLLEDPDNWSKLDVKVDRGVVVRQLAEIGLIRNDVMHFDPDGISDTDLEQLRGFARFMQGMQRIGIV
ncbi:MAG: CBS domain-containing protein [Chloroflexi bacterium]|nr:CBS domain-containing protein [Chloroflexota bacterium]